MTQINHHNFRWIYPLEMEITSNGLTKLKSGDNNQSQLATQFDATKPLV